MSDQPDALIYLFGTPRVESSAGRRVEISSKKAIALLATLATADRFERSRTWLQRVLWGSRAQKQAQSSLRRELSNLRAVFAQAGLDVLRSDNRIVSLDESRVHVDVSDEHGRGGKLQFCEGLDLASEEEFEEWLRDMRLHFDRETYDRPRSIQRVEPVSDRSALPPYIAVVPPTAAGHDAAAAMMARSIGDGLSVALTRMRWLPIVSGDGEHDRQTPACRYLLETNIIPSEGEMRATFSFLEMPGRIIRWTDTRTISPQDPASAADEIARIANCVGASFDVCEQRHFDTSASGAIDSVNEELWRIRFHINQFNRESFAKARILIDQGMRKTPENGELLMLQANLELWQHWVDRATATTFRDLAVLIRAAMRADPLDARGPLFNGILETWQRRPGSARTHLEQACALDPGLGQAYVHLGSTYYLAGDPEPAIDLLKHALFLTPLDPKRFLALGALGTSYWMLGRYEESLATAQTIQATHPGYVLAHVLETASLAAMGRTGEAREVRAELIDRKPNLYRGMLQWMPFVDRGWIAKLRQAVEFDRIVPSSEQLARCS
ncbi:tetratricopeptide repeat protein [Erythrobacteraceae bacterium WH01K]|nr:tetratricopeptide repeat protein [Erythrobacteraceae bacterium WH01K]